MTCITNEGLSLSVICKSPFPSEMGKVMYAIELDGVYVTGAKVEK